MIYFYLFLQQILCTYVFRERVNVSVSESIIKIKEVYTLIGLEAKKKSVESLAS